MGNDSDDAANKHRVPLVSLSMLRNGAEMEGDL